MEFGSLGHKGQGERERPFGPARFWTLGADTLIVRNLEVSLLAA
jgi:hypothetical protein